MSYIRKPLDVERWGKVELWEGIDAAYIIAGAEPERGPDAYLTNKANEVHQALLAAVGIGALKPWRTTESGASYFVAAELVRWAKEKGFFLTEGLETAVHATTLAFLARHKATKETQMRESAFSPELLGIWAGKDLWSEDEFVALLCGVKPEAFNSNVRASYRSAEDAARKAIQRGIAAETLEVKAWLQEEYESDSFQSPKSNPYFSPSQAIAWAEAKRGEFSKFPQFSRPAEKAALQTPIELSGPHHQTEHPGSSSNCKEERPTDFPRTVCGMPKGLTKKQIMMVFDGIHFATDRTQTSYEKWGKALADPPKWLLEARLQRGTRDKRHSALWDPVQIAIALTGMNVKLSKLDSIFGTHSKILKEWASAWAEKSELLR